MVSMICLLTDSLIALWKLAFVQASAEFSIAGLASRCWHIGHSVSLSSAYWTTVAYMQKLKKVAKIQTL